MDPGDLGLGVPGPGCWVLILVYALVNRLLIEKVYRISVFSFEFCEIFKNNNFVEHMRTTASVYLLNIKP